MDFQEASQTRSRSSDGPDLGVGDAQGVLVGEVGLRRRLALERLAVPKPRGGISGNLCVCVSVRDGTASITYTEQGWAVGRLTLVDGSGGTLGFGLALLQDVGLPGIVGVVAYIAREDVDDAFVHGGSGDPTLGSRQVHVGELAVVGGRHGQHVCGEAEADSQGGEVHDAEELREKVQRKCYPTPVLVLFILTSKPSQEIVLSLQAGPTLEVSGRRRGRNPGFDIQHAPG